MDEPSPAIDTEKGEDERKAEARSRSLANLRPCTKGEVRNPTGTNGFRKRQEMIASVLDEKDDEKDAIEPGKSRIRNVILAMARAAKAGDAGAGKTLVEQYAGKAKQQVDIENSDGSLGGTISVVFSSTGTVNSDGVEVRETDGNGKEIAAPAKTVALLTAQDSTAPVSRG